MNTDLHRLVLAADPLARFDPGAIGWTVLGIIGALTVFALVMVCIKGWRDNFSRRPPIDEDLKVYSATVAKLQRDLEKLPDDQKFAELVKRLDTFATVPQMAALQETFHREVKNVDVYAHSIVHDLIRNDIGARITELEHDRVLRGERLAAVEADMRTLKTAIDQVNVKIDGQSDRTVERILEIWRKEKRA